MKSGLIGKHDICQKVIQPCHRQNCVPMVCPQVSAPAEFVPSTRRDRTAF
jgi:hypothetical protein